MTHDQPADQEERERALDPETSCIVQAPAGSGKTTLLVQRFATLLARVERPEQILAITFTRKAAAEMRQRVLKLLREVDALQDRDAELSQAIRIQDRKQGWGLALNPSRLKIQTIDSFARSLAGALPLGAGPEGRATPMEDAAPLYDGAVDRLFERLRDDAGSAAAGLAPEIGRFLMLLDNDAAKARRLIVEMLARRDQWLAPVQTLLNAHLEDAGSVAPALNANVRKLTDTVIEDIRRTLDPDLEEELRWLVQFAADHEGPQGAFWPTAKKLCMTGAKKAEFRKTLTKREGFPAKCKEEKECALATIAKLRELGIAERFAALANLPEDGLDARQVQDLVAICATLSLAVLDLNQEMRAEGYTDFTQLNIAARQALQQDGAPTELALALDYRIRHILIDEFQDTSSSQFELLELLIEGWTGQEDTSIFAVGDPMQSIYRFRDADVGLFQKAKDAGINAMRLQPLQLTVNFRSAPPLVDWFNQTFERIMGDRDDAESGAVRYHRSNAHKPAQLRVENAADQNAIGQDQAETTALPSEAALEARVRLFKKKDSSETGASGEAEALAQEIQALKAAGPNGSIALLVRSRSHLPDILEALRRHRIPWQATDIDPLAERPAVMDLLSLVSALTDPTDRLAWLSLLRTPWLGLDLSSLEQAAQLPEFDLAALQTLAEQLERDAAVRLARLTTSLARWLPRLYEEAPRTVPEAVWLECGAPAAYAEPNALEQAERFFDLVDQLGAEGLDAEQLHLQAERLFASDSAPAQLQILTVHKAKGLEFDQVLLPCLDRGVQALSKPILHWRRRGEGLLMAAKDSGSLYEWLHEEDRRRERHELQRQLYVACTRARRSLLLTASVTEDKPPASGSMLALLWPLIQEDAPKLLAEEDEFGTQPTPSEPPRLLRLPEDFSWHPTPPPPLALPKVPEHRSDAAEGRPARARDVALGNLIHESLCAWGRSALPEDAAAWIKPRRERWRRRLAAAGLHEAEVTNHLAEVERQLRAVLADPDGRWLLGPREEAASEFGVTAHIDGALANAYFDRIFAHEGIRWIIDFKTSPVEDDVDAIEVLVTRHQAQLAHYRTLAAGLYSQPIKTALYLTAIPKLVEVSA